MAFVWKDKKDIWKGEGIYFVTFVVKNRVKLLGRLRKLGVPDCNGHSAVVDTTELGDVVYREFNALQARHAGFHVLAKQVMPDHFHAVVWCKEAFGDKSIKMVMRGFAQACSKAAREGGMSRWDRDGRDGTARDMPRWDRDGRDGTGHAGAGAASMGPGAMGTARDVPRWDRDGKDGTARDMPLLAAQYHCGECLDCGNGATTLFGASIHTDADACGAAEAYD